MINTLKLRILHFTIPVCPWRKRQRAQALQCPACQDSLFHPLSSVVSPSHSLMLFLLVRNQNTLNAGSIELTYG